MNQPLTPDHPEHPDYYETENMSLNQAWCRGFQNGLNGRGPFGIYRILEEDPTAWHAQLVAKWLDGWAKGRGIYERKQN